MSEVDFSRIQELLDWIDDNQLNFELRVHSLEKNPASLVDIQTILELLQSLRANASDVQVAFILFYSQSFEMVFLSIAKNRYKFNSHFAEISLLVWDNLRDNINRYLNDEEVDIERSDSIASALILVSQSNEDDVRKNLAAAHKILISEVFIADEDEKADESRQVIADISIAIEQDLIYFRRLSTFSEKKYDRSLDRINRMTSYALKMNELECNPVDPMQLQAAVLLHDAGMMILPDSIFSKDTNLTKEEIQTLHQHPGVIADMLLRMSRWNEAALIVRDHHERPDGRGYPLGLFGDQISDGAKIIAILDAFAAITDYRAYRPDKLTIVKALQEINIHPEQFDKRWVKVFKEVIKSEIVG